MKASLAAVVLLLGVQFASAQQWARESVDKSPRHREWVTVKYGDRVVEAFVAYP
jgi:carboxymethylenebutenolidase